MAYKPGDKILFCDGFNNPNEIREYTITKVNKDTVQCGSAEMTFYLAFGFPAKYRTELEEICRKRQELKKAYDDSMRLIYQLKNKISLEG